LLGDDYQHVIAWRALLSVLTPNTEISSIGLEALNSGSYDDVTLMKSTGGGSFFQAKFVVDSFEGFDLGWLTELTGKRQVSMSQRALATFQQLSSAGRPAELTLVTNRELAGSEGWLGRYLSPLNRTFGHAVRRLYEDQIADPEAFTKFEAMRIHLDLDIQGFISLLDSWVFRWAHSMVDASELAQDRMRACGLQHDGDALSRGVAFVRELIESGIREMNTQELARRIEALGLTSEIPYRILSVSAIEADPLADISDAQADLRPLFGDRTGERARGLDSSGWREVERRISAAIDSLDTATVAPVLVSASARLPCWFSIGTKMRRVQGWILICELGATQFRTDDHAAVDSVLLEELTIGSAPDIVVTVSISNDVRPAVDRYLADTQLGSATRLDLTHPALGAVAIASRSESARIVEDVRQSVMSALESAPARRVHLFISAPRMTALFLGHAWHRLGDVTFYEDLGAGSGYQEAINFCG